MTPLLPYASAEGRGMRPRARRCPLATARQAGKRNLVNGAQRLEFTGWTAARLDWCKVRGCFVEIIRY
jgi:hypothetical protein